MGRIVRKCLWASDGFTLIELLVVIAIIGILVTIAVPTFLGQRSKAARTEGMTNIEALRLLEEQLFAETGAYTTVDLGVCAANNPGNVAAIQAQLPGFKPGKGEELFFSYCVEANKDVAGVANTPCYRASAFGNQGTPAAGQTLRVDCNNEKM